MKVYIIICLLFLQGSVSHGIEESCLDCGADCLSGVQSAVPICIAAGFEYTEALVGCVQKVLSLLSRCQTCIKSLVCCVTDSCEFCTCDCNHLLRFDAPVYSPAVQQHSWLFNGQCHFAFIGNPDCEDCDGKQAYKSVNCSKEVYLHYHDYILDGRWVITEGLDDDDSVAVLRNRGDGLDDEECPEKETFKWEFRSPQNPASGWFEEAEVKLVPFLTEDDISVKANLIAKRGDTQITL